MTFVPVLHSSKAVLRRSKRSSPTHWATKTTPAGPDDVDPLVAGGIARDGKALVLAPSRRELDSFAVSVVPSTVLQIRRSDVERDLARCPLQGRPIVRGLRLLFIGRDTSHADDGEAEISHLVKDSVQRRLIWKGSGKNGCVAQDLDL